MSRKNAPLSLRMPPELKEQAASRARSEHVSLGSYICDAVRAQLTGKTVRRRRAPFEDVRQDLAGVHAALVRLGNELVNRCDVAERSDAVAALKDVTASLLQLERAIRRK